MKEKRTPALAPFIISFIVMDLIILTLIIAFDNITSLGDGFFAGLVVKSWIILLIVAFIALIVSIIAIKDYLNLRTALAEELMVLIFALWFGIARVPLINDNGEGQFILFSMGSILFLVINIGIQIDLLCAPKIKNFLTTDKKDREATKRAEAISKAEQLFPTDSPRYQNQQTQVMVDRATRAAKINLQETTRFSTEQTRAQSKNSAANSTMPQNTRLTQQPMTEEQLKQFREHQAKRRAARAAAAQQLQNSSVQFDKLTPPSGRTAQRSAAQNKSTASQVESLFFKDE